ncbi:uncharacterized protein LOC110720139 isoform X2 [Chenopodium quinoa]|uniref:uncharacterized protein LOC110720139 isoform X2 n=1 Tax=Chenopodium quinoa TaxID=63459 RepID=UPI000B79050C|nr:uncharacterized protein LOC110720139 isoform X2 [Chenopodium quinoa]
MLNRWISAKVLYKLQSITFGVLTMMHGFVLPCAGDPSICTSLVGDVVFFAGGISAESMARASINRLLRSQCCSYLAIISEVQADSVLDSPLLSSVCVVAKSGHVSEVSFIHGDSSSPNLKVIKRVFNEDVVYHEIEVLFGKGLSFPYNTRNVFINKDLKCIKCAGDRDNKVLPI